MMVSVEVLSGIRVIELGSFITAPYAAMLLADMGADVVKVERPASPDPFRAFEDGLYSPHFEAHNRNKRSLALDFVNPEGREILHRLIEAADVVLLNMRPGVAAKLGLDHQKLGRLNPRLIHCSITGFGPDGPYAARPAFDNVGQALSGWLSLTHQGDDPRVPGPAVSDTITGLFSALGIVSAIVERQKTGVGRRVEVNMLEATMALAGGSIGQYVASRQAPTVYSRAAASQSYVFTCSDAARLAIHLSSLEKFWTSLLVALKLPELGIKYATRAERISRYEELAHELQDEFSKQPRAHWMAALERYDVPFAPALEVGELEQDAQVAHLASFGTVSHPLRGERTILNRPVRYDGDNFTAFRAAPELGENSDEIVAGLGFSADELQALRDKGIMVQCARSGISANDA
jgi:crotonobetainyl-CoA:carnitine CoA-transferase CaiB-like acyl-CoA transferase